MTPGDSSFGLEFGLSCYKIFRTASVAHLVSCSVGTGGFFLGVKLPGREVNNSPPPSAEVKNEWSYISTQPACHRGVAKETFTFLAFYRTRLRQCFDQTRTVPCALIHTVTVLSRFVES